VLLILTWNRQTRPDAVRAADQQEEYTKLGVELPQRWAPAEVEHLLGQLNIRLGDAHVEQEKAQRWASLETRLERLSLEEVAHREKCKRLAERLGVPVPEKSAELDLIVNGLIRWQDAERQWRKAEVDREQTRQAHERLLFEINAKLAPYGYAAAQGQAEV